MATSIGKFKGEGSHTAKLAEPTKGMPQKGMPQTYENVFTSLNVQDMQAFYKAYMQESDKKNPLTERTLVPFKKHQYPHGGKSIPGPATNIPFPSRG